MTMLILSDIHGSAFFLKKVLSTNLAQNATKILLLGDVLYHGPRNPLPEGYAPLECIEILRPLINKIIAVRGNCDSEAETMFLPFPLLDHNHIPVRDKSIFMTHGHKYNQENIPPLADGSALLFGHTHLPLACKIGSIHFWNPGSLSIPKENNPNSFGLLEDNTFSVHTLDEKAFLHDTLG